MKIEDVAVNTDKDGRKSKGWADYLETVKKLKVGQSFVMKEKPPSHYRLVMSVAPIWLGKRYTIRAEGKNWRIGCVSKVK